MGEVGCLKDGNFQNLQVEGDTLVTGTVNITALKGGVKKVGAGDTTLTHDDAGNSIILSDASATTVTLPSPQIGLRFEIYSGVTATADHKIRTSTNGHGYIGGVKSTTDVRGQSVGHYAAANGAEDQFVMNGSTKGGVVGGHITIIAIADTSGAGCWLISGHLHSTGTPETPFST